MPLIDWLPSYNIGLTEIDTENQQMVGMINLLHDSISQKNNHEVVNKVLRQIAHNYQDHCSTTTKLLQELRYNGLSNQQQSHKKFGRVLATFLQRLKNNEKISAMELIGFLRNWFERHILIEDQKIKYFIREKDKNLGPISDLANSSVQTIKWKDSYVTDNKEIDSQHKTLIELYNKLYRAVELKMSKSIILKITGTFFQHAKKHFETEERIMLESGYDNYKGHSLTHKKLLSELTKYISNATKDSKVKEIQILEFIENWFINHFTNEDDDLKKFILKKKELVS